MHDITSTILYIILLKNHIAFRYQFQSKFSMMITRSIQKPFNNYKNPKAFMITCRINEYYKTTLKHQGPSMKERRNQPRVNVIVPVTYTSLYDDGKLSENRMGIVLDVSLNGILIESETIIEASYVKLTFVSYDNKKPSTIGYVANSRRNKDGRVNTGMSFYGKKDDIYFFVTNLVRTYHYRKKDSSQTLEDLTHSAIGI